MFTYSKSEIAERILGNIEQVDESEISEANLLREKFYGKNIFFRGLIEFTNNCDNDCLYCGIRKSNSKANRYRLEENDILKCCETGYALGFRSFVLQGGEDGYYDDKMANIVYTIKSRFPDCAVTLSVGEKSRKLYEELFNAGADRFLLRHETANVRHYKKLHPKEMSLENRKRCLYTLKEIGFQVGAGFMVASPFQTAENLAEDLLFLQDLKPHMVGIGPFIPHVDTPFSKYNPKDANELINICDNYSKKNRKSPSHYILNATIIMVALTRILLPDSLIPATTAVASIDGGGRTLALKAGANVVMPNLSPFDLRKDYSLYNDKAFSGCEAAEGVKLISDEIIAAGFNPCFTRGDHIDYSNI